MKTVSWFLSYIITGHWKSQNSVLFNADPPNPKTVPTALNLGQMSMTWILIIVILILTIWRGTYDMTTVWKHKIRDSRNTSCVPQKAPYIGMINSHKYGTRQNSTYTLWQHNKRHIATAHSFAMWIWLV